MTLHARFIESYYCYHEINRGFRPTVFTGADARAIKSIRERIVKIMNNHNLSGENEELVLNLWKKILNDLPKVDKWLSEQPLQCVNQRFDQLIFKIKNARTIENELKSLSTWNGE